MTGIYKITNPIGQVYIGKSKNLRSRFSSHRKGKETETKLQKSFNNYGFDNHKFEVIYICGESVLNVFESFFVDKYNSLINGLNTCNVASDYSHLEFEPIEISEPYHFSPRQENYTGGSGAPKKFPQTETEILHIRKKVPKGTATLLKKQMDKMISESLTLEQRIEEFYNRDKEKFTPYEDISKLNREVIVEILNNK